MKEIQIARKAIERAEHLAAEAERCGMAFFTALPVFRQIQLELHTAMVALDEID